MRSWYELAILRFSGELFSSGCQGAETDGRFFPMDAAGIQQLQ
jgi:hypothetical protein